MIKAKKAVQEMAPYSPPTSSRSGKIRLDFNENTVGCSPKVIEALKKVTAEELSMYPEYDKLKKLVADFNKIDTSKIILTNAGDEGIMTVMNTFVDKGDKVVLPTPTFAMFKFYAQLNSAEIINVNYYKDLSFPIKEVLDAINDTIRLVVLVNPNNPTGTSIERKDIVSILDKVKQSIVLIDEAYYDFTNDSCIDLIDDYPNLVILRSFSKAYGLGGLRLGYLISNSKNIELFQKVNSPYSITSIAGVVVKAALDDYNYVDNYILMINQNKQYLYNEFDRLKIKYFKGSANFFLADFGKNYKFVYDELKKNNILLRDRNSYVKNCLRITIGTKDQCVELIKNLDKILFRLNKIDTILFDMDGVLVDVSKSYRVAIKQTAEYFLKNKKISYNEIQKYKEKGGLNNDWDCTQAILQDNGVNKSRDEIQQKFDEIYVGGVIDNETLIVDLKLLDQISKKYNLAIITGRPRRDAEYTIKKFGLDKYFKTVLTLDEFSDKSDGINFCIEKFNSKKAIYIGDTVDDIKAANDSNIDSIGIIPPSPSARIKEILQAQGAKIVLDNISQITEVLK